MRQAAAVNHYPHHIGDYAKDTRHLTLMQHGAYRLLMDHVYATEKPLPVDKSQLHLICGAKTRAERAAVDYVAGAFFPQGMNKRAGEEIVKYQDKSRKARESSTVRWHSHRTASAKPSHSGGNTTAMLASNQEPITKNRSTEPPVDNSQGNNGAWWKTHEGIEAKGKELGIPAHRGEDWPAYKSRLFEHINRQKAA